jgi:hypothetical protein
VGVALGTGQGLLAQPEQQERDDRKSPEDQEGEGMAEALDREAGHERPGGAGEREGEGEP